MELRSGGILGHFHESDEALSHISFYISGEDSVDMILTSNKSRICVSKLTLHEAVKLKRELQTEIDKFVTE